MVKGRIIIEVDFCCERMKSECEYGVLGLSYDVCEKEIRLDNTKVLIDCPFCKQNILPFAVRNWNAIKTRYNTIR